VKGSTIRPTAHTWATQDRLFGVGHVRTYKVLGATRTLTVKDTYDGTAAFRQYWHLDPGWALTSRSPDGKRLRFVSAGRTLTVTSTGVATVLRGVARPVAGWNFPDGSSRVPEDEIQVKAAGTATTTFVLT
jgi:hypothetical protein